MSAARTAPAQPQRRPPTLRRPLALAPATLPTARRGLWSRWTAATTIGETIGFGVPALAGGLAYALAAPETATLPLAVIAGAGEGAILGFAQSRVLRGEIAGFDTRGWIVATAAAAALGWAVGMPLGVYGGSLPAAVLVAGVIAAAIVLLGAVGAAQWLVLRRYVTDAGLWVPTNALAWLLGLIVPFAAMALVDEGDSATLVAAVGIASGLGMGFVVAAVTGLAVARLLRPARSRGRPLSRVVIVSRVAHGLVSVLFLVCIAVVYAGAWRASAGPLTFAAVGALLLEGVLVLLSHGNCPLGPLFRQLGDDTPFFELLLPPRAAKLAVPVLAVVTALGIVLLASRTLWA